MATTPAILSFDDAPTKKPTIEEQPGSRVPGVLSLNTPVTSEGSASSKSMLRARLKKLGEATKSKLVPSGLKVASHALPRYLEVEVLPLLLCGVFSLSNVALSRKEMERGYVKAPRAAGSTRPAEISLSLPILHLQSSNGKRKKIIGWDKNQSEPLRVFVDTESKAKVFLEYGIVGQDPADLTPLGTVEVPVRYKTLGPSQLHLNLKKRPLWPANSNNSGGTRILNTKFRLSANARLSLQLEPKEAKKSDLELMGEANTEPNLSMIDEDEQDNGSVDAKITSAAAAAVAMAVAVESNPSSSPVLEPTTTTVVAEAPAKASVVPPSHLPAEATSKTTLVEPTQTETERNPLREQEQTFIKKPSPFFNLFGCLCGNNEQDGPKANQIEPAADSPRVGDLSLPKGALSSDLEDNSLLDSGLDVSLKFSLNPCIIDDFSSVETVPEVETKPVVIPEVETKPFTISSMRSDLNTTNEYRQPTVLRTPHVKEYKPYVHLQKGKDYSQPVKLPMSFSSTTGSVSAVSYSDTDHTTLHGIFCFPILNDASEDRERHVKDVHGGGDDDDDDDEDDFSEDEADFYSSKDGGKRAILPEPVQAHSTTVDEPSTTTTSIARQATMEATPFSLIKHLLLAFKFRCAHPRVDEGLESDLGENIISADYDATWTDNGDNSDLVEMTSDESSSSMSSSPIDGCLSL